MNPNRVLWNTSWIRSVILTTSGCRPWGDKCLQCYHLTPPNLDPGVEPRCWDYYKHETVLYHVVCPRSCLLTGTGLTVPVIVLHKYGCTRAMTAWYRSNHAMLCGNKSVSLTERNWDGPHVWSIFWSRMVWEKKNSLVYSRTATTIWETLRADFKHMREGF